MFYNFNKQEMEYINQKLEESREMQRKNGGKYYTLEEIEEKYII